MFDILVTTGAEDDIGAGPAKVRRTVVESIERSLTEDADVPDRGRQVRTALRPPWTSVAPVWELRVGGFRVFYDVDGFKSRVYVRAVRRKPPRRTTETVA